MLNNILTSATINPLSYYVNLLEDKPFSLVRYGDGEWRCMTSTLKYIEAKGGRITGGGQLCHPELKDELINTVCNPRNYQDYIYCTYCNTNIPTKVISWHNGDVFHKSAREGTLFPLIEQLRKMKVLVLGPPNMKNLSKRTFSYTHFIDVGQFDCYHRKEQIKKEILDNIDDGYLISFSAGFTAKLIIYDLYPIIGDKCFMIDFGSVWDWFTGRFNRGWWKKKTDEQREALIKSSLNVK